MTTTTNIKLSTPAHGSNVDTWDADPVNNNSAIVDSAFGGVTSKALTNVNVTLSATEAQARTLRFSGVLTGNVIINVSAIIKDWNIDNQTTGAFVVTISGGSGNVVGVPQGEIVQVLWDGTNCSFLNLGRIGTYEDDCGSAVPAWIAACTVPPYLLCDGSTFSAVTYPYLASKIGSTTLPDLRGRSRFNLNGGTGRITTASSGIDGNTRFSSGGVESVVLDATQIPSHTHVATTSINRSLTVGTSSNLTAPSGGGAGFPTVPTFILPSDITITNANTGGGLLHTNMPPAQISGITMIRAA